MKKCKISSRKKLDDKKKMLLEDFLKFAAKKLVLKEMPTTILITAKKEDHTTTGGYFPESKNIIVLGGNRLFVDVLRSVAHELTHHKQNERGTLMELLQEYPEDLYSPYENEAYQMAGNIIKEWVRKVKKNKMLDNDIYDIYY